MPYLQPDKTPITAASLFATMTKDVHDRLDNTDDDMAADVQDMLDYTNDESITVTSIFDDMFTGNVPEDYSTLDQLPISIDDIDKIPQLLEDDVTLSVHDATTEDNTTADFQADAIIEVPHYTAVSARSKSVIQDNVQNIESDSDIENDSQDTTIEHDAHNASGEPAAKRPKRIILRHDKNNRDKENHPLRESCENSNCRKACSQKILMNHRRDIWTGYWNMTYYERKNWLFQNVDRVAKVKPTTGEHVSRRDMTYKYRFRDADGKNQYVCKTFFLTTLGYHKKNDKPLITSLRTAVGAVAAAPDMRGTSTAENKTKKVDRSVIREHVESYHPCVSHYRREHAPLRRYLPSDVNRAYMYKDFKETHPGLKCGYDVYRGEVKNMRISFAKLGEEGCEKCEDFHVNRSEHSHDTVSTETLQTLIDGNQDIALACEKCKTHVEHLRSAKISRQHYQADAMQDCTVETTVRSVDLQKVIMLPRMPGIKTAIFTKRIIAFHETFAAVGTKEKKQNKKKNISVVWHEGLAGRKQEEIASTFVKAIEHDRDVNHVVFWLDNCAAQNKNWCLFTTLLTTVNGNTITSNDITLKYFERGHTFMSADSVHHGVEKQMANQPGGNVYDFKDFIRVVSTSNGGNMVVLQPDSEDFRAWVGGQSVAKLRQKSRPMLNELAQVQVQRGSNLLYYKKQHDDEAFQSFDFLKKNVQLENPNAMRIGCRGITQGKKSSIIAKLCPLMPESRRDFWQNFPVDNSVEDLVET